MTFEEAKRTIQILFSFDREDYHDRTKTSFRSLKIKELKGLILAQNERWRRGLGMQVERQGIFGYPRAAEGIGTYRYMPLSLG